MATASDEFFVRFRYWLVSGGMITRIACGMTTSRSVCPGRQPEGAGRFGLAFRHRQDAGAHDLGDEGRRVGHEADEQCDEFGQDLHAAAKVEVPFSRHVEGDRVGPDEREDDPRTDRQAEDEPER